MRGSKKRKRSYAGPQAIMQRIAPAPFLQQALIQQQQQQPQQQRPVHHNPVQTNHIPQVIQVRPTQM